MNKYIDIIIPRGGKNLVKKVHNLATIPTIGHLKVFVIHILIKMQIYNCKKYYS